MVYKDLLNGICLYIYIYIYICICILYMCIYIYTTTTLANRDTTHKQLVVDRLQSHSTQKQR